MIFSKNSCVVINTHILSVNHGLVSKYECQQEFTKSQTRFCFRSIPINYTIYKKQTHLKQSKTFRLGENVINNLRGVLYTKKFRNEGGNSVENHLHPPLRQRLSIHHYRIRAVVLRARADKKSKRRFKWVRSGKDK